ncbi:MAG: alpha/beta fold hydrolase [Cellulomonas sp.]
MSERVQFTGASGQRLVGRLDVPDGPSAASVLFAHCFTCGKDSLAAARIARALTARGFTVLRFDVTGLGESGGDFAEATFSCDVADLVAAAAYLAGRGQGPALLVGHSLGGAAVLAAAARIGPVRAVATIGAPSDPAHVTSLLGEAVPELEARGEAEVQLGGRTFHLRKAFLDDIREQPQLERIAHLGRALLVLHSPVDDIVPIDNARAIFDAARHPKSFLSLDGADHLLTRAADARYVGEVLASWAARYLDQTPAAPEVPPTATPAAPGLVRVHEMNDGGFRHEVRAGNHTWIADEPLDVGGHDSGPGPYDLLLAGLGACTSMTLRMYADRKGWPLTSIDVQLQHDRIHAKDCETCTTSEGRVDHIFREITLHGDLTGEQRDSLLAIADKCPVHRTLTREVAIETHLTAPPTLAGQR